MSTGAWSQMPRHVDGRVRGTDVAQGPLALDARTWHMGPFALDVWDVAKRGDPGGIYVGLVLDGDVES